MKNHLFIHSKPSAAALFPFLIAAFTLASCSSTETGSSPTRETAEITIMADDPLMMTFVDTHDNTYQMEIDPDVAPNPYDPDCFVRSGDRPSGLDVGIYFFSQAINEEEAIEEAQMELPETWI